ncbi:TetR/AcrR family transcriptional regulator [Succinivibrio dextrinosolvens]|uniref:TetR/AcrR family transcriptional regulator n=1 Tax=Succinivibrio dextrinosolvens TaxID=83771 RepID=UPI00241D4CB6|nr:TetR/AcrR family transcriptional regulator [Succinivibrio dextrinosolvens]MBE6421916.1 TetR/AcrR family transcriptional regulator [Succinivibrio dextrinosolvens]
MSEKLTKRQQDALETKKKIVNAAKKLLSQKGFDEISISEITKEAKVSIGSFYTYFKKKEDIISELNKLDFYNLAQTVIKMKDKTLIERLEYYCENFLLAIERAGIETCRQWTRNNIKPLPMPEEPQFTKYQYDNKALYSVFADAVRHGELSEYFPIEDFTVQINAQLYGLMTIWCMSDSQVIGSGRVKSYISNFLTPALAAYLKK